MPVDKNLKNLIDPPSGVLDNDRPWYTAKVGDGTWNLLKLKLTGKRDSHGGSYSSTVNLSDADADKLIATMKTDPRGYPQMDDGGGGMGWYDNYGRFQAWLVEQYLGKKPEEKEDIPEEVGMVDEPEPPEASVSLYEGIRDEDLVEEEIDETILNFLGLVGDNDAIDLDYGTYKTLLREKMAAGRMQDSQMPSEEVELITDEWKRIKSKTGRFKLKKKKITAESFSGFGSKPADDGTIISPDKLLPGSVDNIKSISGTGISESVSDIHDKLDELLETLRDQAKVSEDTLKFEKSQKEKKERGDKEKGLEKGKGKKILKAVSTVLKPVKGIFDHLWNFIKNVLIGRILVKFMDWFGDKKNQKKIYSLLDFLEITWPAILAGFVLFGTALGGFVRTLVSRLVWYTGKLLFTALPAISKFAARHPLVAVATAGGLALGGMAAAPKVQEIVDGMFGEKPEVSGSDGDDLKPEKGESELPDPKEIPNPPKGGGESPEEMVAGEKKPEVKPVQELNTGGFVLPSPVLNFNGGGSVNNTSPILKYSGGGSVNNISPILKYGGGSVNNTSPILKYSGGGSVNNIIQSPIQEFSVGGGVSGPGGIDKVPAMLTSGEFVMSTGAVNKFGAGTMAAMNAAGGGTNKPTVSGDAVYASGGGAMPRMEDKKTENADLKVKESDPENYQSLSTSIDKLPELGDIITNFVSGLGDIMSGGLSGSRSNLLLSVNDRFDNNVEKIKPPELKSESKSKSSFSGILNQLLNGIVGKESKGNISQTVQNIISDPIGGAANFIVNMFGGKSKKDKKPSLSEGGKKKKSESNLANILLSSGDMSFNPSTFLNLGLDYEKDFGYLTGESEEIKNLSPEDKNKMIWAKANRKMIETVGTPDQKEILIRADSLDPENKIFVMGAPKTKPSGGGEIGVGPSKETSKFVNDMLVQGGVKKSSNLKIADAMEGKAPALSAVVRSNESFKKPIPGLPVAGGSASPQIIDLGLYPSDQGQTSSVGGSTASINIPTNGISREKALRMGIGA